MVWVSSSPPTEDMSTMHSFQIRERHRLLNVTYSSSGSQFVVGHHHLLVGEFEDDPGVSQKIMVRPGKSAFLKTDEPVHAFAVTLPMADFERLERLIEGGGNELVVGTDMAGNLQFQIVTITPSPVPRPASSDSTGTGEGSER